VLVNIHAVPIALLHSVPVLVGFEATLDSVAVPLNNADDPLLSGTGEIQAYSSVDKDATFGISAKLHAVPFTLVHCGVSCIAGESGDITINENLCPPGRLIQI
jgi:hypothetical protein